MEKETSIYKKLEEITAKGFDLKEKFKKYADVIYSELKIPVIFCKIFGSRWSFFAGNDNFLLSEKKINLNDNYGMILENADIEKAVINKIVEIIKKSIDKDTKY